MRELSLHEMQAVSGGYDIEIVDLTPQECIQVGNNLISWAAQDSRWLWNGIEWLVDGAVSGVGHLIKFAGENGFSIHIRISNEYESIVAAMPMIPDTVIPYCPFFSSQYGC